MAGEIPTNAAAHQGTPMLAVSRSTTTVADAEEGGFRILREYFCGDTHALFAKMDDTVHPYSVSSLRMKKKRRYVYITNFFTLFDASSSAAR